MDLHLANKVVLVAGFPAGSQPYASARAFWAEGCRTAITGRDSASLAQAQAAFESEFGPERVLACEGDLRQTAVIKKVLSIIRERWGPLDCLVANIGSGRGPVGWDLQESDWDRLFEENLSGSLRLMKEVLPAMTRARQGSIVVVASIAGLESSGAPLPYSAAKAALVNYGKNLARQVGPSNVRRELGRPRQHPLSRRLMGKAPCRASGRGRGQNQCGSAPAAVSADPEENLTSSFSCRRTARPSSPGVHGG